MTIAQIEHWCREIIDRVKSGRPAEDVRVELKADWPTDHQDVARRIAGQANAARGEPILFVIGVDERAGKVVGATATNTADWYAQVTKHFDSFNPPLRDHTFEVDGHIVVALQFESDGSPFVVKTGLPGKVTHEIPWREATGIRSAKRGDLLRLLMPMQKVPDVEWLSASLSLERDVHLTNPNTIPFNWRGEIRLYITPRTADSVVFPHHRASVWAKLDANSPEQTFTFRMRGGSASIRNTGNEVVVIGAGALDIDFGGRTQAVPFQPDCPATIGLVLHAVGQEMPVTVRRTLRRTQTSQTNVNWNN